MSLLLACSPRDAPRHSTVRRASQQRAEPSTQMRAQTAPPPAVRARFCVSSPATYADTGTTAGRGGRKRPSLRTVPSRVRRKGHDQGPRRSETAVPAYGAQPRTQTRAQVVPSATFALPVNGSCLATSHTSANGCVRRSCAYTRSSHRRGRAANSLAFASSDRAALTAATVLLAVREVVPVAPVGRPVKRVTLPLRLWKKRLAV